MNLSNPLMTQLSLCKLLNTPALPDCDGDGLTDVLRLFWEVESTGINEESRSRELCEQLFLTHIKFTNGRYEVGFALAKRQMRSARSSQFMPQPTERFTEKINQGTRHTNGI